MINIAFRLDDPSKTSNHQLERDIIELLQTHQIPATFAVIPFKKNEKDTLLPLSKEDIPHLIEAHRAQIIEIALHGSSHSNTGKLPTSSEFSGCPLEEQENLIIQGRLHLEALFEGPITGFVPPWNSYDENTALALKKQNFHYLSADWNTTGIKQAINLIPHTCNLAHLKDAVEEARALPFKHSVIVVIMHHYDFKEQCGKQAIIDLNEFSNLLTWLKSQTDTDMVKIEELSQRYSFDHWKKPIQFHQRYRRYHWRISRLMPQYCIYPTKNWYFLYSLPFRIRSLF